MNMRTVFGTLFGLARAAAVILSLHGAAHAADDAAGSLRTVGAYPEERGVGHTVTALPDGRVFVYGHRPDNQATDTVVLDPALRTGERSTVAPLMWDPQRHAWRTLDTSPQCPYSHYLHTVTALLDNRVLVAGGLCDAPGKDREPFQALAIWNDGAQQWDPAPSLAHERIYHTATLLGDGGVLFAGGESGTRIAKGSEPVLGAVELFRNGSVTQLPPLRYARARHSATRLGNGSVLVAGGIDQTGNPMAEVEIWDPATQAWKNGPPLAHARHDHSATLLGDGRVLVAGGIDKAGHGLDAVEIFDPRTNAWSAGAAMLAPLQRHAALALGNGDVLLAGVGQEWDHAFSLAMLWDHASAAWRPAGHLFPNRFRNTQSYALAPLPGAQDGALVFDSGAVMRWSRAGQGGAPVPAYAERDGFSAIPLKDGRVLMVGGHIARPGSTVGQRQLDWAELYDPASGLFAPTGRMTQAREAPASLVLDDGRVLVAGNRILEAHPAPGLPPYRFVELWDPASGRWSALAELDFDGSDGAVFERFAQLADGRVMLVFSVDKLHHALFWDPRTRAVDTRPIGAYHVGTAFGILPDGRVLAAWGAFARDRTDTGAVTIWDSRTGRSEPVLPPPGMEGQVTDALVLRDGNVLVMGHHGYGNDSYGIAAILQTASLRWRALPQLPDAPSDGSPHAVAELRDGAIATGTLLLRPGANGWTPIPAAPQNSAAIVELPSGRRLALSASRPHVAFMDEATGQWRPQAPYYLRRKPEQRPLLVELADGRVMVAGNIDQMGWPRETTVQVWDPKNDAWTTTGKLAGVYPGRAEAARLPSGQVLVVALDRRDTLKCEVGHPDDNAWTDCGATLPFKAGRPAFTLGTLDDGRIALLFGQAEAYAYSEPARQWQQVPDVSALIRTNPALLNARWRLPDGCSVSGLPLRLFKPNDDKGMPAPLPAAGIKADTARLITLSDGTVVVAGYPEGADDIGSGFFHRKASCAGFEARTGDDAFMPAVVGAAPEAHGAAAPAASPFQRGVKAIAAYKWVLALALAAVLGFWALRRGLFSIDFAGLMQALPGPLAFSGRALLYALLALMLVVMLPIRCQLGSAKHKPGKAHAVPAPPCRFVGVWQSSRGGYKYRITLTDDGTFTTDPVSTGTGSARVQTGTWTIKDDKMIWYPDLGEDDVADVNPISDESDGAFTLREMDGQTTRFQRLGKLEAAKCRD